MIVAKQLLAAKELINDAKKSITLATNAGARSAVSVAEGSGQTAKIGFPQNIPMLVGYAAQAVGIVSAIKKAVSKVKGAKQPVSPTTPTPSAPPSPSAAAQSLPPAFNVIGASGSNVLADAIGGQSQTPIQTYVVSSEVTSSQALERNIESNATL